MVNLTTRMVNMELHEDSVDSDSYYGDFTVKIVWGLFGDSMQKIW